MTELPDVRSVRLQNLDAVIAAVSDDQPPLRVDVDGVGGAELARTSAQTTERPKEAPISVEDRDPGDGFRRRLEALAGVPVSDVDISFIVGHHVVGGVQELVRPVSRYARRTDREEQTALGAELQDYVPLTGAGRDGRIGPAAVRYPNVSLVIDV